MIVGKMTVTVEKAGSLEITDFGAIEFSEAYALQRHFVEQVVSGACPRVMLCEHPPVITLGRLASETNILASPESIQGRGIQIIPIDRGGEVTLHCPGQLVVYPILDLHKYGRDLRLYMNKLEQVAIDLLSDFDIVAKRIEGKRGVWVGARKIASIGIGVRKWVSYHGIAININPDLKLFSFIKPCGMDIEMTSLEQLSGSKIDLSIVKGKFIEHFRRIF